MTVMTHETHDSTLGNSMDSTQTTAAASAGWSSLALWAASLAASLNAWAEKVHQAAMM